jgi:hypothetical protein
MTYASADEDVFRVFGADIIIVVYHLDCRHPVWVVISRNFF